MAARARRLIAALAEDRRAFIASLPTRAQALVEERVRPPVYEARDWPVLVRELSERLAADLEGLAAEPAATRLEARLRDQSTSLAADPPFPLAHNSDFAVARLCYAIARARRPGTIVETGVAYGVTSAFLCLALAENARGRLHSIDKCAAGANGEPLVGALVPPELRERWELRRGASRRELPALLREVGAVDLFLHDSRHSYVNIRRELRLATPRLAAGAVVVADDVERNSAFGEWAAEHPPAYWAVAREPAKPGLCGVAVM